MSASKRSSSVDTKQAGIFNRTREQRYFLIARATMFRIRSLAKLLQSIPHLRPPLLLSVLDPGSSIELWHCNLQMRSTSHSAFRFFGPVFNSWEYTWSMVQSSYEHDISKKKDKFRDYWGLYLRWAQVNSAPIHFCRLLNELAGSKARAS